LVVEREERKEIKGRDNSLEEVLPEHLFRKRQRAFRKKKSGGG